jgi:hypothetical protein
LEQQRKGGLAPIDPRTKDTLRDHGFEIESAVPIIGVPCAHEPEKLRIAARGRAGLMIRCRCGRSGMFMPVPERPLNSAETDLMVALAREAAWFGGRSA